MPASHSNEPLNHTFRYPASLALPTGSDILLGLVWISGLVWFFKSKRDQDQTPLLCQLSGILWTTLPDLASAFLRGQIINGTRSTVRILPGSVFLCAGPVPGLLGWACCEQLGLSSTS